MSAARPFDFAAARDRLERARRRAEEVASPGAAAARRLLEARARELARPPPAPPAAVALEALEFLVGAATEGGAAERLAVPVSICLEVVRAVRPVELPGLAPWFRGVVLHRGELLPAVDLDLLLGGGGTRPERVVVVGHLRPELALVAVELGDLLRLSAEALRPPPPGADPLVRALGPEALAVLDGAALLADRRLLHDPSRGD